MLGRAVHVDAQHGTKAVKGIMVECRRSMSKELWGCGACHVIHAR
jgi:hypothetical protein